jgi:hypothetical protein
VHARKNIFGYRMMVWAIVAIGALSFMVWAHHMYVSGMNPYFGFFFATTTLIIAIPTALKVYNWVLTLWHGNIHLSVPMLFAIGFIFSFIHGGLTGLFLGNVTVSVPLSDTMFVVAHFHMVMAVAPVMRQLAALGGKPELRMGIKKAGPVVTDQGNLVIDVKFDSIDQPAELEKTINNIPGVLENGLFVGVTDLVLVGEIKDGAPIVREF